MEPDQKNPSKIGIWWRDLWEFICALWPHTAAKFTGGSVAAVIALISSFGVPIPHWVIWALISIAFFASAFVAYRRQRRVAEFTKINLQWPMIFLSFAACVAVVLVLVNYEFISPLSKILTKPDLSTDQIISSLCDDVSNPKIIL